MYMVAHTLFVCYCFYSIELCGGGMVVLRCLTSDALLTKVTLSLLYTYTLTLRGKCTMLRNTRQATLDRLWNTNGRYGYQGKNKLYLYDEMV